MSERTSVLGGETRARQLFGNLSLLQVAILAVSGVSWILLMVAMQSLVVVVLGAIALLVLVGVMWKTTSEGESWFRRELDRYALRWQNRQKTLWVFTRRRPPGYDPVKGVLPAEVGDLKEFVWDGDVAPVSVLYHRSDRGSSWGGRSSYLSAVFEIRGGGDGIREWTETFARSEGMNRLLSGLAAARSPIVQLDLETRVLPTDPAVYRDHVRSLVSPTCPPLLRESMLETAEIGAAHTETYRSYATVRIDLARLAATQVERTMSQEETVEAAVEVMREAAERLHRSKLGVLGVLGPRRVAAMVRHLYVPSYDIDDVDGLSGIFDAWSHSYVPFTDAVRVDGPTGSWWHAVATVPRDAWPTIELDGRWLENLVTGVHPRTIRTVKTSHQLVDKMLARQKAKIGLTYDTASISSAARKGQVSTGEDEASASAAGRVMADLLYAGAAGDQPSLRVVISAPERAELRKARNTIDQAASNADITRLKWFDDRHHQALMLMAPMARGAAR